MASKGTTAHPGQPACGGVIMVKMGKGLNIGEVVFYTTHCLLQRQLEASPP
jgi:hypothetical protein